MTGAVSLIVTESDTALLPADTLTIHLKLKLPPLDESTPENSEVLLGIIQAESSVHRKIALHLPCPASLEFKNRVVVRVSRSAQLTQ